MAAVDCVDLTLSDDEAEPAPGGALAEPAPAPAAAAAAAAGPSSADDNEEVVIVTEQCCLCQRQGAARLTASCSHNACEACVSSYVDGVELAYPPPRGEGADAAFAAFACPGGRWSRGCGAPLLPSLLTLPPKAHRWLAACLDGCVSDLLERDCPACRARASVPSAATPASKKGKKDKREPGVCRECHFAVATCDACGSSLRDAAGGQSAHVSGRCESSRAPTLALARALAQLRAAHHMQGGAGGGAGAGSKRKRAAPAGGGTGYGGSAGAPSKAQKAALAKAQTAQGAADEASVTALAAIAAALASHPASRRRGPPLLPLPSLSLLHASGIAACLASLLRSASLFDADRSPLLRAALRVLVAIVDRSDALPLLCSPSAACAAVPPPGAALFDSAEEDEEEESGDSASVADVLHELDGQAEALLGSGGGDAELNAVATELRAADARLRAVARQAGHLSRRRRRGGAAAAGPTPGDAEAEYASVIGKQTFDTAPLAATHYFKREATGAGMGGEAGKQRMRRIAREAAAMRGGLPCAWGSVVAVRVDEDRPDMLQCVIVPHRDTPYGNGVFVFDIMLPSDYPANPPRVQLLTTGGGRVRFNPNLYACGKVRRAW
jgi:baculoviral IAP repeat-containing protein 6